MAIEIRLPTEENPNPNGILRQGKDIVSTIGLVNRMTEDEAAHLAASLIHHGQLANKVQEHLDVLKGVPVQS